MESTILHYLMIKTHNVTGMKYLCKKSTKNIKRCFTYLGSGVFWQRHLKKHGKNITTEIIETCSCMASFREKGLFWSNFYNVVDSPNWANLVAEDGGNSNNSTFEQMVQNRKAAHNKIKNTPEYIETRKKCGEKTRERQLGKPVKERMPEGWVDPRKGKKMKDIYHSKHLHAQIKPFKIILNDGEGEWIFGCESEVYSIGLDPAPTLYNMKQQGFIYIKRVKSTTKHEFKKGDKLTFCWISLEEYKNHKFGELLTHT